MIRLTLIGLTVILLFTLTADKAWADAVDDLIAKYYNDIVDRDPDAAGAQAWKSEFARIVALGIDAEEGCIALARFFFHSEEYATQNKDDTQFVADLYQTFLDREPDPAGLNFWVGLLDQGLSRNVVLNSF
ncbi:MAG: DUF4214 domain-containing protein, partial [Desulfobacterales bacterium]